MTKPVYFGKSVVLECSIQTEDKSAPMLWTKLPNGKTLACNQKSRDIDKYAVSVEYYERKMVYNLILKHFNSTDVNRVYKCDFGFHSYAGNLLLNENDFIYEPSVKNMKNFSLDNRKLNGIVMIYNGYPKPLCSGKFEGEEISKFINICNKNISIFYETKIELEYITDMCSGTVNVTCNYGNHTVLITQLVDTCKDSPESNYTAVQIMLTTLAGFMLVLTTLRLLAKGDYQSETSDLHGISTASCSRIIHQTCVAINTTLQNINFPIQQELTEIKEGLYGIAGFPNVIGTVDGTLIPIQGLSGEEESNSVCRKGYHVINVQAVVVYKLRFNNVVVRWPGGTHDAFILQQSILFRHMEALVDNGWLLGDSCYPLKSWLITPLGNPSTAQEIRFQKAHCKTRNTVERAFGVLKQRFR
ncbi:HARBI1 [Mytilus coruscus]|uniref:HARBI1 n=1 Tax=Mytilus coruscus TaxID=42192 RepID=A0A6J7ZYI6_MYTCO|nr:HARBI1 [Mytilus coruscus]